jgi:hypothetical protein
VPPYTCQWLADTTVVSTSCSMTVSPTEDTTYMLIVIDDAQRSETDEVTVFVQ